MGDEFYELESIDEKIKYVLEAIAQTEKNKEEYIHVYKKKVPNGRPETELIGQFKITMAAPATFNGAKNEIINSLLPYAKFMNNFKEFACVLEEFFNEIRRGSGYKTSEQIDKLIKILEEYR